MEGTKLYVRIFILALMTLGFAGLMVVNLYGLHTTTPPDRAAKVSDLRYASYESTPAARGQIYDRYGRELVVNRLSRNIEISATVLKSAEGDAANPAHSSQTILDLITLCKRTDTPYTDNFPVTMYPYRYVENDSTQTSQLFKRLQNFLEKIEQKAMTAEDLMVLLRDRYNIPESWSEDDARLVVGIRYEADLRNELPSVPPYLFAQDVSVELMSLIMERGLTGVSVTNSTTREYRTQYAAHLLGRIGPIYEEEYEALKSQGYAMNAIIGKDGIEKAAESWLRGVDGTKRIETNAQGQITNETYSKTPSAGNHVLTTLDIRLQEAVERALERGILKLRSTATVREGSAAEGGAAVVINVQTGEVLSIASYPTYPLERYSRDYTALSTDSTKPLFNRALQGAYEPGSIFKMCTGLAALESGIIAPKATIYDKGRYMYYAPSYTPTCLAYPSSHGAVNASTALKVSCNYYYYDIGRQVGIDTLNEYAEGFGFGALSGIELGFAESAGVLVSPAYAKEHDITWNPGDLIQAAIGQYNTFTPLQMAVYTATVANGGIHYRPHLLKTMMSYDYQSAAYDIVPEVIRDFNFQPENIRAVQEGMRLVAKEGTAQGTFRNYPITVAAKTGTAQVSASRPDNGVFVSYAPYDNPEIAVVVVVEKGAGGSRVAPIARDIFDAYFEISDRMTALVS